MITLSGGGWGGINTRETLGKGVIHVQGRMARDEISSHHSDRQQWETYRFCGFSPNVFGLPLTETWSENLQGRGDDWLGASEKRDREGLVTPVLFLVISHSLRVIVGRVRKTRLEGCSVNPSPAPSKSVLSRERLGTGGG